MVVKKKISPNEIPELSTNETSDVDSEVKKSTKTVEKPKVCYDYAQQGIVQVCLACGGQKSTDGSNKLICTAAPGKFKGCPRR